LLGALMAVLGVRAVCHMLPRPRAALRPLFGVRAATAT
jgi:hypothetical protein